MKVFLLTTCFRPLLSESCLSSHNGLRLIVYTSIKVYLRECVRKLLPSGEPPATCVFPQLPRWKTSGEEWRRCRSSSTKARKGEWWSCVCVFLHTACWCGVAPDVPPALCVCSIVVLAGDTLPIDVYCHLPIMCEDRNLPYAYIPSKVVSLRC